MKSNKKVELFVDLGLKEICGLISLLGTNRDAGIQEIITVNEFTPWICKSWCNSLYCYSFEPCLVTDLVL